jgi:hypothetical protein
VLEHRSMFPEEGNCAAIASGYLKFSFLVANSTGDFRRLTP